MAATWTNSAGGLWGELLNWSDHLVPLTADATINLAGTYSVTVGSDAFVRNLLLDSPAATLEGNGTLTVSEVFTWKNGTLGGPASGMVVANGGLLLTGPDAGIRRSLSRMLINAGPATWDDSGTIQLVGGATFTNTATGTLVLSGSGRIETAGGSGRFSNGGLMRKIGSGTTEINAELINTGTFRIESGTVGLRLGTLHSGSLEISNLARLTLSGGTHTFTAGSTLTGKGGISMMGGTATFEGLVDVSGEHLFSGGTVNLMGRYNAITNLITIAGAHINFSGTGPVIPASLVITNQGALGGTSPITVQGPMFWSLGRIVGSGSVVAEGGLQMFGGGLELAGRAVINRGSGRWSGPAGSLTLANGATITNQAGASFDLDLDAIVAASTGSSTFVNEGLFRKTGGHGVSAFTTAFSNRGSMQVNTGTLSLNGGGDHIGTIQIGAGARLNLGGTHAFSTESTVSGPGTLAVVSGTANLDGLVDVSGEHIFSGGTANLNGRYVAMPNPITITGGTANFSGTGPVIPASLVITNQGALGGTSPITVQGPMFWSLGRIVGSGSVVAEGGLQMFGGGLELAGRAVINRGSGRWSGPAGSLTLANGATITNQAGASFDLDLDAIVAASTGSGTFVNEGLFRKTGGEATSAFTVPFSNSGTMELLSGTLRLDGGFTQTAGDLRLRGGNLMSSIPIRLFGGRLSGSGTVAGTLTNTGSIQPGTGPGRLIVNGNYFQGPSGTCEVLLGGDRPEIGHDQLVISNLATLDGALVANLAGGFAPAPHSTFEVLKCNGCTGAFATFEYPSNAVGMALEYSISNVIVRVINTPPILDPIPDQEVGASGSLNLTVTARDADIPLQNLRFALTDPPAGATIDSGGLIRWSAGVLPAGSSAHFTVVVTDNGTPNLSRSRTFTVRSGTVPGPVATSLRFGVPSPGSNTLTFRGVPGTTYLAEYSLQVVGPWLDFATATAAADGSWMIVDSNATNAARFYRAR